MKIIMFKIQYCTVYKTHNYNLIIVCKMQGQMTYCLEK